MARPQRRTDYMSIRLSPTERREIERAAKRRSVRMSDFVRSAAVDLAGEAPVSPHRGPGTPETLREAVG